MHDCFTNHRKYPRYELPPDLPVTDYYRDSAHPGSAKTLRHNDVLTYGGLQPHDVIYDSALGMHVDVIKKEERLVPQGHTRGRYTYETPHMM